MKQIILSIAIAVIGITTAQNVNIPDANFKASLLGNPAINTNGDDEIQYTEAVAYDGVIAVVFQGITDLTGIEEFVNITMLLAQFNSLTTLDLSNNPNLTLVNVENNELTSLTFGSTINTNLTTLNCFNNQLTTLDVSKLSGLIDLNCYNNQLTALDISDNINLYGLICHSNSMETLTISSTANQALKYLNCEHNNLNTINVSDLNLTYLRCSNNQLTTLDLSNSTGLTDIHCEFNQLTSLNLKNGNNTNIAAFNTIANMSLYCIEVDDPVWSTANLTEKDPHTNFSEDCSVCADVTAVSPSNIGETTADISWTAGASETTWKIEYGTIGFVQGSTDGTIVSVTDNPHTLTGLTPNTAYDVYVQSDCGSGNVGAWIKSEFTTLDIVSRADFTQNEIKLFPNPFNDFVMVSSEETIKSVWVYNLLGQQILQNAEITNKQMDLSSLSSGTYLLKITLENGSSEMFKVVKD